MKISARPLQAAVAGLFALLNLPAQPLPPQTVQVSAPGRWLGNGSYVDKDTGTPHVPTPLYPESNPLTRRSAPSDVLNEASKPAPRYASPPHLVWLDFPPAPPVWGESALEARVLRAGSNKDEPAGRIEYRYEPFYVPLVILAKQGQLSPKQRASLAHYREMRESLLADLRAQLESASDNDTRAAKLAAFAQTQAGPLARLEATADELRAGLARSAVTLANNAFWRRKTSQVYIARTRTLDAGILNGEAVFQNGYSRDQRFLLREMALEADAAESSAQPVASDLLFFAPENVRIHLPRGQSPELSARIAAYQAAKSGLKEELRTIICDQYGTLLDFNRVRALRKLAANQAARFAQVEAMEEEIRQQLETVAWPNLPESLRPPRRDRIEAQPDPAILPLLTLIKDLLPRDQIRFIRLGENFQVYVVTTSKATAAETAKRQAVDAALTAFNREPHRLAAAIAALQATISNDHAPGRGEPVPRKYAMMQAALEDLAKIRGAPQLIDRYFEYRTAVLEPGLSPAQRRLLVGNAFESLGLLAAN